MRQSIDHLSQVVQIAYHKLKGERFNQTHVDVVYKEQKKTF